MTSTKCTDCSSHLILEAIFLNRPIFLRFRVDDVVVKWTPVLQIDNCQYRLCGLIYYRSNHFIAKIVTENQEVWFNDGMTNGRAYSLEGDLIDITLAQLATAPNTYSDNQK